jgi:hypothetical protein
MADDLLDETLLSNPVTLLYCDPPWGQALVNGFRTKAGLDKATYRWEELYHRVAQIGHRGDIPVWIEGSKFESKDGQMIPFAIAHRSSTEHEAYFPITYSRNKPAGLYYAGTVPHPKILLETLGGEDDVDTPGIVMSAYPKGTVVDPCAGAGLTSRHAERLGWSSVNNELSTYRMSAAIFQMVELTGEEARRL